MISQNFACWDLWFLQSQPKNKGLWDDWWSPTMHIQSESLFALQTLHTHWALCYYLFREYIQTLCLKAQATNPSFLTFLWSDCAVRHTIPNQPYSTFDGQHQRATAVHKDPLERRRPKQKRKIALVPPWHGLLPSSPTAMSITRQGWVNFCQVIVRNQLLGFGHKRTLCGTWGGKLGRW